MESDRSRWRECSSQRKSFQIVGPAEGKAQCFFMAVQERGITQSPLEVEWSDFRPGHGEIRRKDALPDQEPVQSDPHVCTTVVKLGNATNQPGSSPEYTSRG